MIYLFPYCKIINLNSDQDQRCQEKHLFLPIAGSLPVFRNGDAVKCGVISIFEYLKEQVLKFYFKNVGEPGPMFIPNCSNPKSFQLQLL